MLTQNLPEFWDNLYANGKDYWNFKKATPALLEFFKHPSCPATGSVLIPGAGFGYDAEAWAKRGHDVLAVDFAATAVDELDHLSRAHKNLRSLDLDLFTLSPKDANRGGQQFDIVYDYGTFSAIHPGRRDEFFEVCYRMMKDDGVLILFLYPLMNGKTLQGPPHPTSEGELMARLGGVFDVVERIKPVNSLPEREGKEEIWLLKKCL
ncbi:MAG: methyltransferase domain-containing protein [Fibrobacter sp.]|jgi:SAM-dependent methyltransferase|uniref:methyltransferase n=1 Tax=unclassified Fibrobacter TaxID=2634177 RepID=UPI00091A1CFD|nr:MULTISPECIES: methyltransferase [unclassified Fibrobacter]MBO4435998.1 methyltransferase domain-containing protein [Fibrobacter sp.]MBQ3719517.1 methyltransferase domain-containing protein [Fibrobacter sp.]MBQ9226884.1 methyltransferase domain-containing protein [Fibrobacter sp.]MBR1744835.1 methyltransferase domain-containing protein [Fibrobacter sp.]MBR2059477.1 methyltransferase domain-containing protein [Fibrobacter sp.]